MCIILNVKEISSTIEGFNKFSFTKKNNDILYFMKKNSITGKDNELYKHV